MPGEHHLPALLRHLSPVLDPQTYVFCTLPPEDNLPQSKLTPLATVLEPEGLALVVPKAQAESYPLGFEGTPHSLQPQGERRERMCATSSVVEKSHTVVQSVFERARRSAHKARSFKPITRRRKTGATMSSLYELLPFPVVLRRLRSSSGKGKAGTDRVASSTPFELLAFIWIMVACAILSRFSRGTRPASRRLDSSRAA